MLVAIVEDEADLAENIEYNLKREGFDTLVIANGGDALATLSLPKPPDLYLLDLMLPDVSGTEICRRIRANPSTKDTPVIMVTAKGEEVDRVVGFEVGADDYVVKPFSVRELLLRVRAVLRRAQAPPDPPESDEDLRFGLIHLDVRAHKVFIDANEVALTALEFRLLRTFVERRGRVQSREALLRDVWEYSASNVPTRTVDTHVKRLRDKLGKTGHYVETVRGVGYRFAEVAPAS